MTNGEVMKSFLIIVILAILVSIFGCWDLSNDTTIYPPKGSADFAEADADGDGTISAEEWRAYQARE
jgi:hypothetical protein